MKSEQFSFSKMPEQQMDASLCALEGEHELCRSSPRHNTVMKINTWMKWLVNLIIER